MALSVIHRRTGVKQSPPAWPSLPPRDSSTAPGGANSYAFAPGEQGNAHTGNELAKMFRSHGMIRDTSKKTKNYYAKKYPNLNPLFTFGVAGFNFRSTELNAALGINQLKNLDKKMPSGLKDLILSIS